MSSLLKCIVKKIIPDSLMPFVRQIQRPFQRYKYKHQQKRYVKIIEQVKKKDKITVAFFLIHESVWKCEGVYRLMEKDDRFNPIVIICPYIVYGHDVMLRDMDAAYKSFTNNNYNVIKTYDEKTDKWLDVKQEINPDIVFFTNPHKLTKDEYYITNYLDRLTCYVPYGLMLANIQQAQFNQLFHNLCWQIFCETPIHVELARKYAVNKGINVTCTGFPQLDDLHQTKCRNNPWKKQNSSKKKIIWAPHHTIEDNEKELAYSCFFLLNDFMFETAEKYSDEIQIAFKPHPILRSKLNIHKDWGIERTDAYYKKWQNISIGQLEEGVYVDLFLISDAMIFDSISFITEYMVTERPSLFTIRDNTISSKFNEFGALNFNLLYHANDLKRDIVNFIENVIKDIDPKKNERIEFAKKYLTPPNAKTASENIYENIKNNLK